MSAGLDASTVTPGSTAPDASLTVPARVPSTCAVPRAGRPRSPKAKIRVGAYCRSPPPLGVRITSPPPRGELLCIIRYMNLFPHKGENVSLVQEPVKPL